jgi:hypothetical protein
MSTKYPGGIIPSAPNYSLITTGTGYLRTTGNSEFAIPTANTPFTVEAWIYPLSAGNAIFSEQVTGAGNPCALACSLATAVDVGVTGGARPAFGWYNGTAWTTAAATDAVNAVPLRAWTHLAFVFTGSTSKIYKNGIDITATTPTPQTSWGITTANGENWYVGKRWDGTASFNGYMSGFRFVNGTAVYTSNFNPPGLLSPIPNTVLLTAQYETIRDGSPNNFSLQPFLGATTSTFSPFGQPVTLNPALGGGANGVWTLDQAASAIAADTWPVYDPLITGTSIAISGTGVNGAGNGTFLDSSSNNFTVTPFGDVAQGTRTPFAPTGWSVFFNTIIPTGSLSVSGFGTFTFGTGDFTIEGWFKKDAINTTGTLALMSKAGASTGFRLSVADGVLEGQLAATIYTGITPVSIGVWHHFAFARAAGTTRLFLDGNLEKTGTGGGNITINDNLTIGSNNGALPFNGSMSNIRVVIGTALYTSAFTPPTSPLTAVAGTQLLTLQNSYLKDNSSNNYAITGLTGAPPVTPISPFKTQAIYSADVFGGSSYFDGTGDYLTVPDNVALRLDGVDFTIEHWIYITGNAGVARNTINKNGASVFDYTIRIETTNRIFFYTDTGSISSTTVTALNTWYHVAVTKSGTTTRLFINGVQEATSTTLNITTTNTDLWIGARQSTAAFPFMGYISGVRILKGTALYTANFTPPTLPPTNITDTSLLLNFTNAGIISPIGATGNTVGGFSITDAESRWGGGSLWCRRTTGARNYMSIAANPNLELLTGNFTIECWVYPLNFTITSGYMIAKDAVSGTNYPQYSLRLNSSGNLLFSVGVANGGTSIQTVTGNIPVIVNSWNHVAAVRFGTRLMAFVNGVLAGFLTQTITPVYMGRPLWINTQANGATTDGIDGYINDIRITQGYARYLGPFEPPTSALQGQ